MRQKEFEWAERARWEKRIRERIAVLGLPTVALDLLMLALHEGHHTVIDGDQVSILRLSVRQIADTIGSKRSTVGESIQRLKNLDLLTSGRKRLLVHWDPLIRTKPDDRRTNPDEAGRSPDKPGRSRTIAGQTRTKPDDRRTNFADDEKGIPFSGNGPHARLRSDRSDSDDDDVRVADLKRLEATPCETDPAETVATITRIREGLGWAGKINRRAFDLFATAAVLSTRFSKDWLERAIDTTARKRREVKVLEYFQACLRNNLAEVEGLCSSRDVYVVFGNLWQWARPGVRSAAHYIAERRPPCPK